MEKKLDEQFIVKDTKSKSEYIQKIDLFLNSHKGFRPPLKDSYVKNQHSSLFKNLSERYECELLDSKYFCHGELHSGTYYYFIVYSQFHKRVKVVAVGKYYWEYTTNSRFAKFLDDDSFDCSLSAIRRLYRKLVTEIVDHSILLRYRKNMRDDILHFSQFQYCFNSKKKYCSIFEDINVNVNRDTIAFKRCKLALNGISLQKKDKYSYTYTYTFDDFYHEFLNESTTWSNDFNKDIMPLLNQSIQDELESINAKNAQVLAELNIS